MFPPDNNPMLLDARSDSLIWTTWKLRAGAAESDTSMRVWGSAGTSRPIAWGGKERASVCGPYNTHWGWEDASPSAYFGCSLVMGAMNWLQAFLFLNTTQEWLSWKGNDCVFESGRNTTPREKHARESTMQVFDGWGRRDQWEVGCARQNWLT